MLCLLCRNLCRQCSYYLVTVDVVAPAYRHFATLPIHVAPSLCARLQIAVSLGPPEGATTHHRNFFRRVSFRKQENAVGSQALLLEVLQGGEVQGSG